MTDKDNNPISGLFKGLEKFINVASDMVNTGENIKKYSGEINGFNNEKIKSAYDVTIKLGLDDKLESFKNLSKNRYIKTRVEPNIDVFDEKNEFTIIILANNIKEKDINIQAENDVVVFEAQNENVHYYKEISIPSELQIENIKWSYKNGIIKVDIQKQV